MLPSSRCLHMAASGARARCRILRALGLHREGGARHVHAEEVSSDLCEVGGSIPDAIARHNPMPTRASYGCPVGCWFCIVQRWTARYSRCCRLHAASGSCDDNLSALPADYQAPHRRPLPDGRRALLDANSGFEPATFDDEVYARWKPIIKGPWRFDTMRRQRGERRARVRMLKMSHRAGSRFIR